MRKAYVTTLSLCGNLTKTKVKMLKIERYESSENCLHFMKKIQKTIIPPLIKRKLLINESLNI